MRKFIICCILTFLPLYMTAGITTYTFTSKAWASKVGATPCDGTTDGWVSDKEASEYMTGRLDAEGRLYSQGVSVKTGSSGAGATSVLEFTDVRRITFNFCQNSSDGRGTIFVQVGENEPKSIVVTKPATSGSGVYNRDSIVLFETPQTGKIKFWVECTKNAININTISIRSASGGSSPFTMATYQLVTDEEQLKDSDQIIIGVAQANVNYIMGYFDESVSSNNIHAIKGKYNTERTQVEPDDRAIYTLHKTTLNNATAYYIQDEIRYETAYLVASGGQTKNRLALWDKLVDEKTYGNYGYWDIKIENGQEAVITNLGNSKSKIIQYNASNNPTLFSCYESKGAQTPVCIYRRVEAMGDVTAIIAPMVNFGATTATSGAHTIEVNANRLSEDITASLTDGSVFSLSATTLDRDGDNLTISYFSNTAGHYTDTLVLRSGETETRVLVMLQLLAPISVAEAVHMPDYSLVYLNDVVITKKYDMNIYIRDETGSMLIFDRGNVYGQGLKAGDPLSGVMGRMLNYYGVPELSPTEAFSVGKNIEVEPETAPDVIDSADVCRYILLESAVIQNNTLTYKGLSYTIEDKFNIKPTEGVAMRTYVIVSYDWNVVTLYIVKQEASPGQGIDSVLPQLENKVILRNGIMYISTERGLYTLEGKQVF